jgi:hypothetical protein
LTIASAKIGMNQITTLTINTPSTIAPRTCLRNAFTRDLPPWETACILARIGSDPDAIVPCCNTPLAVRYSSVFNGMK